MPAGSPGSCRKCSDKGMPLPAGGLWDHSEPGPGGRSRECYLVRCLLHTGKYGLSSPEAAMKPPRDAGCSRRKKAASTRREADRRKDRIMKGRITASILLILLLFATAAAAGQESATISSSAVT